MQTGLSSHAMRYCKLKPDYFDFTHAKRHHAQKNYLCTLTRVSPVVLTSTVLASTNAVSRFSSVLDTSQIKSRTHISPPCCVLRHVFPRSKGRSKPRITPILASRWHPFPGSKGRSSVTAQAVVVSLLLLLLLLLQLLLLMMLLLLLLLLLL